MSLEAHLRTIVREEVAAALAAFKALAADVAKRGPGRPVKGESPAPPAASSAAPPAPVALQPSPPPSGAAPPAAPPATAAIASLTHAQVAPAFLAAAKTHGRDFVISVMCKLLGCAKDPEPTFDKVPVTALAQAKAMLEAGPQKAAPVADATDLLG